MPSYPARDYVAPIFAFNTTEAGLGEQFGLLGFADDNWVDGTQSLVFAFDADVYREVGYGFTGTIIHEVGHHIGMSHPHDGFDPETGVDFGADGEFFFAWAGDESETVMHYLTLSNQFGEHNRDNMYRWEAAGYLNWANVLAGDILASPNASSVFVKLVAADALAAVAKAKLDRWDYLDAVERARSAYLTLVSAADDIGVSSARLSAALRRLPASQIRKYVCRPRQLQRTSRAAEDLMSEGRGSPRPSSRELLHVRVQSMHVLEDGSRVGQRNLATNLVQRIGLQMRAEYDRIDQRKHLHL